MFKIKPNDNLVAIFTYIRSDQYHIDLMDLVDFCISFDYYKELYENFHIIYKCIEDHNEKYNGIRPKNRQNEYLVDAPEVPDLDKESLL